jgi:hypothetical protein
LCIFLSLLPSLLSRAPSRTFFPFSIWERAQPHGLSFCLSQIFLLAPFFDSALLQSVSPGSPFSSAQLFPWLLTEPQTHKYPWVSWPVLLAIPQALQVWTAHYGAYHLPPYLLSHPGLQLIPGTISHPIKGDRLSSSFGHAWNHVQVRGIPLAKDLSTPMISIP